jgi:hypothetical protein
MRNHNYKSHWARARFVVPMLFALAFCGCESPVSINAPVSEADFRAYGDQGHLTLSGQVPRYSKVPVHLDPATPYTDEFFRALARRNEFSTAREANTAVVNPIMLEHRRTVMADNEGVFVFENLPPGRYYVAWYDSWLEHSIDVWNHTPKPLGIGVTQQFNFDAPRGKWHFRQITIRDGQHIPEIDFD